MKRKANLGDWSNKGQQTGTRYQGMKKMYRLQVHINKTEKKWKVQNSEKNIFGRKTVSGGALNRREIIEPLDEGDDAALTGTTGRTVHNGHREGGSGPTNPDPTNQGRGTLVGILGTNEGPCPFLPFYL